MKFHCRCARCRARRILKFDPDEDPYVHCLQCYHPKLVVDWHRTNGREANRKSCLCDGFPFPHRLGSRSPKNGYRCVEADEMLEVNDSLRKEGVGVETYPNVKKVPF